MAVKRTIFLDGRLFKVSHMKYEFNIQTGHFSMGVGVLFWGGSHLQLMGGFNLLSVTPGDVSIIPSIRIWGYVLHVERVPCVITNCGQHQWVIPSLFPFLNNCLGLAGGKHYQKITKQMFKVELQNFAFQSCFSLCYLYNYYVLSSG